MIAWLLWFFVAPHVFLLNALLQAHVPYWPDLGVALCLVCAVHARPAALPGLLFCAAVARTLLHDGDLPVHFLAMGLPVAALLPLRVLFFRRSPLWQCAAAGFLALTVPKALVFFARLSHQAASAAPLGAFALFLAMLTLPLAAWALRSVPPLSLFVERSE